MYNIAEQAYFLIFNSTRMKKYFSLLMLWLLGLSLVNSQDLQAYMFFNTFYSPDEGPYVETYISVVGESVHFMPLDNGKYQGSVEITLMFKKDNEIKSFKKYELLSPEIEDTLNLDFNFIDQQRFPLPNGVYNLDILIADKNTERLPYVITQPISVDYPYDKINISGIELIESYYTTETQNILSKSGYDLVPYVSNFFPEQMKKLRFYVEIYNTEQILGSEEKFLLTYFIESFETEAVMPEFIRRKRENANSVNVLFSEFDITKLPTGNYNLVVEVRDRNNELLETTKLFFQRSNPHIQINLSDLAAVNIQNTFVTRITNSDTLAEFIRYLYPISSQLERTYAQKLTEEMDHDAMQKYFYNFWNTRNNFDPEEEWYKYYEEVQKVNAAFSTVAIEGYKTDRGRVYLQYGPPNAISESYYEPNAYPYEIWHFYQLKTQRNKKFVFYCRELATNDFELIHSDAVGETVNYQWQFLIHERGNAPHSVDQNRMENHWGSKINDYFDNPR